MHTLLTELKHLPSLKAFRLQHTQRQPHTDVHHTRANEMSDERKMSEPSGDPGGLWTWKPGGPAIEIGLIAIVTLLTYLASLRFDLFDVFVIRLAHLEHLEIDEFILPLLILTIGLMIFSIRRRAEAQREVVKRIEAEERLRRQNAHLQVIDELKDEFLANAGHELRTPLTSIQGFSEILLSRHLTEQRRTHYVEVINEQANHMSQIIENLLDIAQLADDEHLVIETKPVEMDTLIDEVLAPFTYHHPEHVIRHESEMGTPPVLGEAFQLKRVIRNLVDNAIRYSPDGGAVTIRSRVIPGYLEVSVEDEGIGLTREQQKHFFDKFYQVNSPEIERAGIGVGLTISKLIVESHGGQIDVTSKPGEGSTFTFTVPLAGG